MSEQSPPTNRALNVLGGLTIAWVWFCVFFFFGDAYLFPAGGDEVAFGERLVWGVLPIASTAAMAVGLKLRSRSPRKALWLIVVGAIGPMVWFWTIFIYGPLMVATIAVAVNSTPRRPRAAMT